MGTLRKRGNGWYAEVCVDRKRKGKTCRTKAAAEAWIKSIEGAPVATLRTWSDVLDRYARTKTEHKRSKKAETLRLKRLEKALGGDTSLADLTPDRMAEWRDTRLQEVSVGTVLRDWTTLHHIFSVACAEWEWIERNPMDKLKRPAQPQARQRVWQPEEIEALVWSTGWPGTTATARVGGVLLFALETAMRAGEILAITPEHVHDRHVHVPRTKNGHPRDVPLTQTAKAILAQVDNQFDLTGNQLDALFRKVRDRVGLRGLTFHDTRRTALTRLAKVYSVMELARISGHLDPRLLQSTYYAPSIDDLADKLTATDRPPD